MIEVDGSKRSGSGTILRLAVALSAITCQPLHMFNIRQNRPQPGLKPQHLEAVQTAAKLCGAELVGARANAREIWFRPGEVKGGNIEAEIGTAGSISMLLITILPICICAGNPVQVHVRKGGTDVPHAPTINYMRFVLLPTLQRMGIDASIDIQSYGYYPKGNGEITMSIRPEKTLRPILLDSFGKLEAIKGFSVCTYLAERRVAERQARAAKEFLDGRGFKADVQIVNDESNPFQKGSSIVLWAQSDLHATVGADAIGELRKTSETVGAEAAEKLCREISAGSTVDMHLADMLVPYMAMSQGSSTYLTRSLSEHVLTNIWLVEEMLGVKFRIEKQDSAYRVDRIS